jgi:predicted RNase H-like nuclease (RuvC/YqgF family)
MNREESISLANELCSEYKAVQELQKKIDENETLRRLLMSGKAKTFSDAIEIMKETYSGKERGDGND